MMIYMFCNQGHCHPFHPKNKIIVNPLQPPVSELQYYKERVKQENRKSVYIMDETGSIIES